MTIGTAVLAFIALLYLSVISEGFRLVFLTVLALAAGGLAFLADFGSDKPQTIFYNHSAHPAYLMAKGDGCPADRHIWNGWCVK